MQLITHLHGGKVARADKQEFGKAELELDDKNHILYKDIPNKTTVWMSHGTMLLKWYLILKLLLTLILQ